MAATMANARCSHAIGGSLLRRLGVPVAASRSTRSADGVVAVTAGLTAEDVCTSLPNVGGQFTQPATSVQFAIGLDLNSTSRDLGESC
jgi:hypothetical protein